MSALADGMKIRTQPHITQAAIVDLAVETLMLATSWSMVDTVAGGTFWQVGVELVIAGSLFLLVVLYQKYLAQRTGQSKVAR